VKNTLDTNKIDEQVSPLDSGGIKAGGTQKSSHKKISSGDILLFKAGTPPKRLAGRPSKRLAGRDFLSRVIAWGTKSPYSHVAVCVSPEMNLAIEANTRGGVRAIDLRSLMISQGAGRNQNSGTLKIKREVDVYRVKEGHEFNLEGVISFLVAQLNNKYDLKGVIYLGFLKLLAIVFRRPLRNAANKWQKDRDYFCSELCSEAFLIGGGLDIVPEKDKADITSPGDIAKSEMTEMV
jgi:hypothetical protein